MVVSVWRVWLHAKYLHAYHTVSSSQLIATFESGLGYKRNLQKPLLRGGLVVSVLPREHEMGVLCSPSRPRRGYEAARWGCGFESQWPSGLRRVSAAARLLGLRVRIPSGVWMFVCVAQ